MKPPIGPGHEADGQRGEGAHGGHEGVLGNEVLGVEHQRRGRGEEEEVVPFQRGAHKGGQGHLRGDTFVDDA